MGLDARQAAHRQLGVLGDPPFMDHLDGHWVEVVVFVSAHLASDDPGRGCR